MMGVDINDIRLELGPLRRTAVRGRNDLKTEFAEDSAIFSNSTSKGKGTGLKRRAEEMCELLDQVEVDLQQVDEFWRHVPVQRMVVTSAGLALGWWVITKFLPNAEPYESVTELAQGLAFAVSALGLLTWGKWKRNRHDLCFRGLDRIRALAHVVDMHHQTRDTLRGIGIDREAFQKYSDLQIVVYLNYCSRILGLLGKAAAMYGEHCRDSEVLTASSEVQLLCNSLAGNIWDKIDFISERVQGGSFTMEGGKEAE